MQQAVETEMEGVPVRVITAEHLVAIALSTARAKDFARILQFVDSGVLDADKLGQILLQHGLVEQWEQFRVKFLRGEHMSEWMRRVLESKRDVRLRLRALSFSEKLTLLEKLRDRSLAIARSPLNRQNVSRLGRRAQEDR